jgi:hypothetical protein
MGLERGRYKKKDKILVYFINQRLTHTNIHILPSTSTMSFAKTENPCRYMLNSLSSGQAPVLLTPSSRVYTCQATWPIRARFCIHPLATKKPSFAYSLIPTFPFSLKLSQPQLSSFNCLLGFTGLGLTVEIVSLSKEGWDRPCQEEGSHRDGLDACHRRWIDGRRRSASCGGLQGASSW